MRRMSQTICPPTKTRSMTARGLIAVTSDTRLAAPAISDAHDPVDRQQQRGLGDVDEVAAVDDLGRGARDLGASAGRLGPCGIKRRDLDHQSSRRVAIVGQAGGRERLVQPRHLGLTENAHGLAHRQRQDREAQQHQEADPEPAEDRRTGERGPR